MEYQNLIIDFIQRTKENQVIIEEQSKIKETPVYEVTQLINSMLGLLIFPSERYCKSIPRKKLQELLEEGWVIPKVEGEFQQAKDLRELIRYLRNTIAH